MKTRMLFCLLLLQCGSALSGEEANSGNASAKKDEDVRKAEEHTEVVIGKKYSMHSKVLNEDRPYWVRLPQSYQHGKYLPARYPVLYLLDGDAHFHSASGMVQFMSEGPSGSLQIPEMIVVGIPNTNRIRDLTPTHSLRHSNGKEVPDFAPSGGGNSFLKFIQEELVPEVESKYRTLPYRIVVGHSFGGLLALHAMLEFPDLFQAYIAIDPSIWWDDKMLLTRAKSAIRAPLDRRCRVYISQANVDELGDFDPSIHTGSIRRLAQAIKRGDSPSFRTKIEFYEDENHGSVPLLSLYRGLRFIFKKYRISLEEQIENPDALATRLKKISEQLGVDLLPPEHHTDGIGLYLMTQSALIEGATNKAAALLRINVANYPESFNAYDSLARVYETMGETALAIDNLEKSLKLKPDYEDARKRLEKLKN